MKPNKWETIRIIYPDLKDIPNFIMAVIIKFVFQIRFKNNAFHSYQKQNMPD